MIVYGQILCIRLHANEGRESETKDSPSQFSELFQREKSAHYTGKYGSFLHEKKSKVREMIK